MQPLFRPQRLFRMDRRYFHPGGNASFVETVGRPM
jgi:hypothetical protein